jgi:hypothetical protein
MNILEEELKYTGEIIFDLILNYGKSKRFYKSILNNSRIGVLEPLYNTDKHIITESNKCLSLYPNTIKSSILPKAQKNLILKHSHIIKVNEL